MNKMLRYGIIAILIQFPLFYMMFSEMGTILIFPPTWLYVLGCPIVCIVLSIKIAVVMGEEANTLSTFENRAGYALSALCYVWFALLVLGMILG